MKGFSEKLRSLMLPPRHLCLRLSGSVALRGGTERLSGWRIVATLLMFLVPASGAMADDDGCAELKGKGVRTEAGIPGDFREGAFRLSNGEAAALLDHKGRRIFGSISIVPFGQGYEAFWKPISGTGEYLVLLNGMHEASLVIARTMHWTLPYPLGTAVGPLAITSCADIF
ncbi:hypothetical protein VSR69_41210 [Paraburkholderia phytofirmans]